MIESQHYEKRRIILHDLERDGIGLGRDHVVYCDTSAWGRGIEQSSFAQGSYSEGEVVLEWINLNQPLHEPGKVRDRLATEIKDVLRQFEEGTIPVTVNDYDLNPMLFCYELARINTTGMTRETGN